MECIVGALTFTITTSRRLDLFIRTMDSFLKNCLDKSKIGRWVCSDDRSSLDDIHEMQSRYPFLEIHQLPPHRKGQAANLNNVFSLVNTDWFFHCEDDWEFIKEGDILTALLRITEDDKRIRNVTLRYWECTYVRHGSLGYRIHVYSKKNSPGNIQSADMAWWGYTLNPGLQHLPTIKRLGPYDEKHSIQGDRGRFFDRPQAQKYWQLGLKRANLMEKYIEHIGGDNSVYETN